MEKYTIQHITELRSLVTRYRLSVPADFHAASDDLLVRCYNGIGPDRWIPILRKLSTWLLSFFEADALVHDYEFCQANKSYWHFTMANTRFCWNALLLAFQAYPAKTAVKVGLLGVALGVLCQAFGYSGYLAGTFKEEK